MRGHGRPPAIAIDARSCSSSVAVDAQCDVTISSPPIHRKPPLGARGLEGVKDIRLLSCDAYFSSIAASKRLLLEDWPSE